MVKVAIFSKRGRRFFKILRGRIFCSRMNQQIRRSCGYSGPLSNGVHVVHLSDLGYDSCDSVI